MYELCQAHDGGTICMNSAFHEQMAYLISAFIFTSGTILMWPGFFRGNKEAEETGELVASWCFVFGSLGFVIAGFWNALSLAEDSSEDEEGGAIWRKLTKAALFISIIG